MKMCNISHNSYHCHRELLFSRRHLMEIITTVVQDLAGLEDRCPNQKTKGQRNQLIVDISHALKMLRPQY